MLKIRPTKILTYSYHVLKDRFQRSFFCQYIRVPRNQEIILIPVSDFMISKSDWTYTIKRGPNELGNSVV